MRHDEKMTVYVTSDELLDIEHARLTLRRERVRIVPPAAFLLAGDGRYVLAEGTDARRPVPMVTIDLDPSRPGRCYTGGRELPIADSFTAFLTVLAFRGVFWR